MLKKLLLSTLLAVNLLVYLAHIQPPYSLYFSQLTSFGQILVILNFFFALRHGLDQPFSKKFTRFHILTFSIQTVVVIGFWGLRMFFKKGIIDPHQKRDWLVELLSMWVHGGGFLTLIAIGRVCKLQFEFGLGKKLLLHLYWAVPYIAIQCAYHMYSGEHIYRFLQFFDWKSLVAFQSTLYVVSILSDYFLTFALEHKEHKKEMIANSKQKSK